MNTINILKKIKKNILLFGTLATLGTCSLYNTNVYADNKQIVKSEEKSDEDTAVNKVEYYSNVFGIKKECIYDMLDYMINESDEDYSKMNQDELIITATRKVYYDHNYSNDIKRTNKEYEVTLSPEEMVEKYSEIYGINKEVALSIVYCECGSDVDSYNYRVNNNPAGLGPDMYFENKEIGIIYFINLLKESYGCKKDSGTDFLYSIASTYCEIPDHWLSLTLPFYNSLCNDYYYNVPEKKKSDINKKETSKLTKTYQMC